MIELFIYCGLFTFGWLIGSIVTRTLFKISDKRSKSNPRVIHQTRHLSDGGVEFYRDDKLVMSFDPSELRRGTVSPEPSLYISKSDDRLMLCTTDGKDRTQDICGSAGCVSVDKDGNVGIGRTNGKV